jgi:hypothetical protein
MFAPQNYIQMKIFNKNVIVSFTYFAQMLLRKKTMQYQEK